MYLLCTVGCTRHDPSTLVKPVGPHQKKTGICSPFDAAAQWARLTLPTNLTDATAELLAAHDRVQS